MEGLKILGFMSQTNCNTENISGIRLIFIAPVAFKKIPE
jgi:hypothetical protein